MPHLIAEYGSNTLPNVQPVLRALHETLAASGHFGTDDIKVRARRYEDFLVGGSAQNGFVHLTLWLLDGRSESVKQALGQALCETVLQALQGSAGVQVTVDVRDITCASYAKVKT